MPNSQGMRDFGLLWMLQEYGTAQTALGCQGCLSLAEVCPAWCCPRQPGQGGEHHSVWEGAAQDMPPAARPLNEEQMEHFLFKFSVLFQTYQVLLQAHVVLIELPGPSSGTPLGQAWPQACPGNHSIKRLLCKGTGPILGLMTS